MELFALERMYFEVEQRKPDPHRRQHLDQRQTPVREEQLQTLKEHDEGADREDERSEDPPRAAQREDGGLHGGLVVVPDRAQKRPPLPHEHLATRGAAIATARPMSCVGAHWAQGATTLSAALGEPSPRLLSASRHSNQTGEKTAQTSDSVIITKR